ncbi:hypothetical protein GTH32_10900 [Alteromonas sp. 345S023]|uniref:Uncharacterized protein n=1 Tax=Alteromonas profundi TaxID=2696062 RepID=A0A7X5LLQ9_9ALTE|nr:hypothetical protein [Alteromonas profundi]NDV91691.1 hypothetical protein [Alteromonas profundi]
MNNNQSLLSYKPLQSAALRHNINLDILVTSAFIRSMPHIESAILEVMPQSIIANLAIAAGTQVSYLTNAQLCEQLGMPFIHASKSVNVLPIALAAKPQQRVYKARVEAGFEKLSAKPEPIRLQTPDTFLGGRRSVNWLALNTVCPKMLAAAKHTVAKHRPLISGRVLATHTDEISAWCIENGYTLVDNYLEPVGGLTSVKSCWLVPSKAQLQQVRNLLAHHAPEVSARLSMEMMITQCWPALAGEHDLLARETYDLLVHRRRWYYLDNLLNIGLYDIDSDGENYWRWLGDKGCRLFLPLRAAGHYVLSFSIFSLVEGLSNTPVRCFINGKLAKTCEIYGGDTISIPYYASEEGGMAEVFIAPEKSVDVGDRKLSVSLSGIVVNWEEAPL